MGRKTFVVNWLWMVLAFEYLNSSNASMPTGPPTGSQNATKPFDTETSGSERNRRLIPYMTFYLPPTAIPINQQYAINTQRYTTNSSESQVPPTAIDSAGPLPPPGYIAVPTSFLRMKTTATLAATVAAPLYEATPSQQQQQQHQQQQQPQTIQAHYRPTNYDNQYAVPISVKLPILINQQQQQQQQPLLHLLPPGPSGNALIGVPIVRANKQKTVQHFPPLEEGGPPQRQQQQLHQNQQQQEARIQEEPIFHRQAKINPNPFRPSNKLPGDFVPIIYTPVSGGGGGDVSSNSNNNVQNTNYQDTPDEASISAQLQRYQQQDNSQSYNDQFKQQNQNDYDAPIDYSTNFNQVPQISQQQQYQNQNNQQQQQQPHIKFLTYPDISGPSSSTTYANAKASTQAGPVYHVIKESSPSDLPQHQPLISQKQQQQLTSSPPPSSYPRLSSSKHPHFHPPKSEGFYVDDQQQQQKQHQQRQQHQTLHEQYFHMNDLTPQEQYVMYLRQRVRYNKQEQQQQLQQKQRIKSTNDGKQQYVMQQYTPSSLPSTPNHPTQNAIENVGFVFSTTATPLVSYESDNDNQNQNYPQHSPIRHTVYLRPELPVPANHQPTAKPLQQLLHIPVQSLLSEIDSYQKTLQPTTQRFKLRKQQQKYQQQKQQQQLHQHSLPLSPQYADNSLDEPKHYAPIDYASAQQQQQQHQQQQQSQLVSPTPSSPPQAAFIIITTAAPPRQLDVSTATPQPEQQQHNYHLSTRRPIYQSSPTLRLQPIPSMASKYAHVTERPNSNFILSSTPNQSSANSKHYGIKYVSTTPSYNQLMTSPTPAIRLKPSINYASPAPTIAYQGSINKNYVTPQTDQRYQHKQQQHQQQEQQQQQQLTSLDNQNQLPDIRTSSLAEILHKLQASNHLPQTLTPDNIDNSIKTLITILNNLKQTQTIVQNPPQHHEPPPATTDYDYSNSNEDDHSSNDDDLKLQPPSEPNKHPGPSTGRAGIDYPNYAEIPQTSFDCNQQRYKGFFGDPETNCQVWHYCDLNGGKASFLCPNGTIFSQIALTCDWWFNVKCSTTPQLYVLNERLYKYILPFNKKFPEDYSGPIVDKYLAMKFKEMEEKMLLEKEKKEKAKLAQKAQNEANKIEATTATATSANKHHHEISEQSSEKNLLTDDIPEHLTQKSNSFNAYESTIKPTTTIATTTTATTLTIESQIENDEGETLLPLSVRPIVVPSSTIEPIHNNELISTEYEQNYLESKETDEDEVEEQRVTSQQQGSPKNAAAAGAQQPTSDKEQKRETTKISIEKVDVIEIKPDGTSGHLTPQMFYRAL